MDVVDSSTILPRVRGGALGPVSVRLGPRSWIVHWDWEEAPLSEGSLEGIMGGGRVSMPRPTAEH